MKSKEIRGQGLEELKPKLKDLELQLITEKAQAERGTSKNAGKIKVIKRTIARIKTIMKEKGGV